jgi:hypothetical protein
LTYYEILGIQPSASEREVRQAYRELSRQYHPDTTLLPLPIAKQKFQQLNEAYATLSSQVRRHAYDHTIGYSRVAVVMPLPNLSEQSQRESRAAYLDPSDRPLSSGELFALFAMGVTLIACLILAIVVGFSRGEVALQPESAIEFGFQPVTTTAPNLPPIPLSSSSLSAPPSPSSSPKNAQLQSNIKEDYLCEIL